MDIALRTAIADAIGSMPQATSVVAEYRVADDGSGHVRYSEAGCWIDPTAPGFTNFTRVLTDEEAVRAYLLARLASTYGYPSSPRVLEVERVYLPVGRPGKGGRTDVLVREPSTTVEDLGKAFLFIEVKAPSSYDSDFHLIDGQLFRLSLQEQPRPRYLVYYTVELKEGRLRERLVLVDTETFATFASWEDAGQPITDVLPTAYGAAAKRRYANVAEETEQYRTLDRQVTADTFSRLRGELHDVIWGGGGTNNNEVFVIITKLILCKIYDEKETTPGSEYRFQRRGDAVEPESTASLVERMNDLYREAEAAYLALPTTGSGDAFDPSRIAPEKIAYVVGRLESISLTENTDSGDLLGDFFEQIVSRDFTQTRGQFFTPLKLVKFMLALAGAVDRAQATMLTDRDHLGRPRLPFVIDPSAGSGTFLIQYMKLVREALGDPELAGTLPNRVRDAHVAWFSGSTGMSWAREHLFAIENNYDLGLSAKVNMVLHGDGSANTWIMNGLLPFNSYWVDGRNNVLGISLPAGAHPYVAPRNEQFDLVLSNPPFSITLPPDEKERVRAAFSAIGAAGSEATFVERWYQLLREGGRFCCVVPEALLDTSRNESVRMFLIQHFEIEAVVALPYDAFRPFTSTKTCVMLARKRPAGDVAAWKATTQQALRDNPTWSSPQVATHVATSLGWADASIFMAEPASLGYKRRRGLSDLRTRNDLYGENEAGDLVDDATGRPSTVIGAFRAAESAPNSPLLGFRTSLGAVVSRGGLRLDPKYRWLWDFQHGLAHGRQELAVPLSDHLEIASLEKVPKGALDQETPLVDLESVKPRRGVLGQVPTVDEIGSDKVRFGGCDLAIAKLEPYLGKVIRAPVGHLGTTEWVGLRVTTDIPVDVMLYLLMLPDMCEAYRRLQSGKRHARFDPKEFLQLRAELPPASMIPDLQQEITRRRDDIETARNLMDEHRRSIDSLFSVPEADATQPVADLMPGPPA